jgi:hypothetical protein
MRLYCEYPTRVDTYNLLTFIELRGPVLFCGMFIYWFVGHSLVKMLNCVYVIDLFVISLNLIRRQFGTDAEQICSGLGPSALTSRRN